MTIFNFSRQCLIFNIFSSYAKNFLPILFNLYVAVPAGSEEAGQRLAAFETAKLFYQISDPNMVNAMFDKALQMHKEETVLFTRDAVMDLLRSMVPHIETSRIEILYKETMSRVDSKDQKEQKKAYRLLEEICRGPSPAVRGFLISALPQLRTSLLSSLSATSPSSQAPRLRCLTSILRQLEDPSEEFALALIPEAVLCIRAVNGKARTAAFTLLVAVGEALQRWNTSSDSDEVISRYMASMLAGLAGNPGLIHCTVLAVSRIYFQFRDIFPEALTEQVLTNVLLLLSSSSREVAGAALSFIKVFITSTPLLMSSKFVPRIVEALVVMPDDCRRHFRVKTKFLLERLCRKFGWDFVSSLVPQSDVTLHKRLKNMRKEMAKRARTVSEDSAGDEDDIYANTKKQKTMEEILADSSDEEDDTEESRPGSKKNKKSKKTPQTWIKEGGEEVVDLLSSTASQAVSSSNPKTAKTAAEKPTKKEPFKINNEGKLIINDDDDSDDEGKGPKRSARAMANMLEDSDDEEETFDSLVSGKRRKTGSSEVGSQKSAMSGVQSTKSTFSKYEPSGTGIHRKVEKDSGSEYRNKSGKGDVKRKGKHDPYAYIPLTHKALNKRKQSKAKGQFSSVLNAAKKGAKKGHKSNVREMKSLMKKMKV